MLVSVVIFISLQQESAVPHVPEAGRARTRGCGTGLPGRDRRTRPGKCLETWTDPCLLPCITRVLCRHEPGCVSVCLWKGPLCPCALNYPPVLRRSLFFPDRPQQHRSPGRAHPRRRPHHPGRSASPLPFREDQTGCSDSSGLKNEGHKPGV